MSDKGIYKIDEEHKDLSFRQLAKIPKYAAIPYFELLKLLPEHQRNERIEKDKLILKNWEIFINKCIEYDISKGMTSGEAAECAEYFKSENFVLLEMRMDDLQSSILNDAELTKNIIQIIQTLELRVSMINPSPIDTKRDYLIYIKERLNGLILQLKGINDIFDRSAEKKKSTKKRTSFIWQNKPDTELPELHSLMTSKYNLIAPKTTYEQIKAVFTEQPIDDDFEPITWVASNRLLAYFLDCAFYGQDWQSIVGNGKLFKNKKGKIMSANDLSVAKYEYSQYGNPKGYEKIDLILSTIKKHSEH
jgi:hypothetical protein